ncbi:MAG: hypothetical protein NW215_00410 [Hyphomicrobiales bacterium]|nr:hypothetical protein [Hyphomicrobiales bacterium]
MTEDEKPKRAPRRTDAPENKPRRRKARQDIPLDEALEQTRTASFVSAWSGDADMTAKERREQKIIARGVAAGLVAAEHGIEPEDWSEKIRKEKEAREHNKDRER